MTAKLEELFKMALELAPEAQDRFAAEWLAELKDEKLWDEQFAKSQDVLERMAEKALEDFKNGKTVAKGWDEI